MPMNESEFEAIIQQIKQNSCPTALDFYGCQIDDQRAMRLASALENNHTILSLTLQMNQVGNAGAQALARALEKNQGLQTLVLSCNQVGDEGAGALARMLEKKQNLQSLYLNLNEIGDRGAQALASGLEKNRGLQTLELDSNQVGDSGAHALALASIKSPTLQTLSLGYNKVGIKGTQALAFLVAKTQSLQSLNLRNNEAYDLGAQALARALETNQSLRYLNLINSRVGDMGAQALASGLEKNQGLQTFFLDDNPLGVAGNAALIKIEQYIARNKQLALQPKHKPPANVSFPTLIPALVQGGQKSFGIAYAERVSYPQATAPAFSNAQPAQLQPSPAPWDLRVDKPAASAQEKQPFFSGAYAQSISYPHAAAPSSHLNSHPQNFSLHSAPEGPSWVDQSVSKAPVPLNQSLPLHSAPGGPSRVDQPISEALGALKISFSIEADELTIGKELGQGGFGVVYEGKWRKHTDVAIKQLHIMQFSRAVMEDFQHEIEIMAQLRGPNIIQLYGASYKAPYRIVMELMPKGSLFHMLHSKTELPWAQREQIALDIAYGLSFLHSHKPFPIIHRDLKSLNVLLDDHFKAKLSDFGLATVKAETNSVSKVGQSQAAGTLAWMAPELFKPKGVCNKETDMYSYGMTLWELSSRELPFKNARSPELIPLWVGQGEREEIPKETPPYFGKLITFCWDAQAAKRPTADQAIENLKAKDQEVVPSIFRRLFW